jgi:hypothetical protein
MARLKPPLGSWTVVVGADQEGSLEWLNDAKVVCVTGPMFKNDSIVRRKLPRVIGLGIRHRIRSPSLSFHNPGLRGRLRQRSEWSWSDHPV